MKKNWQFWMFALILSAFSFGSVLSVYASQLDDPAGALPFIPTENVLSKGPVKIGFPSKYLAGSSFWVILCDAVEAGLRPEDKPYYVLTDAQEDIPKHIASIEDMISNNFDALIVSCSDADALNPVLREANLAGIPIVIVDTESSDESLYIADVMNDNVGAATLVGEYLAKSMDYKGKAICYYDTLGMMGINKGQTVQKILEGYGIEVIHVDGLGHADEAMVKLEAAVQANPDVKAIHCFNGPSSESAITVVQSAGLAGKVFITTIDASKSDCENIKAGKLLCAGTQRPKDMGSYTIEALYKVLEGKGDTLEKHILCPAQLITKENVDSYDPF
jgi:ribose transport system substrate-binding protein